MYTLTLTKEERLTFNWIGDRYATGDAMANIISDFLPDDLSWLDDQDITFHIPEYRAWEIRALSKQENDFFPCFGNTLKNKILEFIYNII